MGDTEQDQPGKERLGLLVPVCLGDLVGRVHDQGVGEGCGILAEVEAVRRQPVERVVGRSGQSVRKLTLERVEDMDGAEALPRRPGDRSAAKRSGGAFPGSCLTILTLGVDHQHGALGQ